LERALDLPAELVMLPLAGDQEVPTAVGMEDMVAARLVVEAVASGVRELVPPGHWLVAGVLRRPGH